MGIAMDGYPYHPIASLATITYMDQLSVLIVGAGPTGLTLACELARRDINFRIIEKKSERTQTSNALGIQARTIELFDDMGIVNRFLDLGDKAHSVTVHSENKALAHVILDQLDSIYKFILMVPQNETERILDERLNELGHHIERNVELISVNQSADHAIATVKNTDNKEEKITATYIVACDGIHSAVRESLKIPFPGEDITQEFVVTDAHVETNFPIDQLHVFLGHKELLAFFPITTGRYRITTNIPSSQAKEISQQEIKTLVEKRSNQLFKLIETTRISPFWIHSRVVPDLQHGNIFFAGDTAHVHSPVGGQGMNTGIQDAYNLAWKLALVIHNKAKPSLLESYHPERHPVIENIVKTTERMTKMMFISNPIFFWLRNKFIKFLSSKKSFVRKLTMQISQLAIAYKQSPIVFYKSAMSSKSPQPGEKAPDVVINHNHRLIDVLRGTQHNILFFTGFNPTEKEITKITEMVKWLHDKYSGIIKVHVISNEPIENCILDENLALHKRYHVQYAGIYLIRPDNYIAYCDNILNKKKLERYLNTIFNT